MRKTLAILIVTLVAALGTFVPAVAAAVPAQPRVVIIVGPTHSLTSTYRAYADLAYAEARKYTTDVVKVYSPNATWARVKAALVGANVVIYMGHGNGWPSPYTFDPAYTTKDGFGLNATAGAGDSNTKYYGEPSVATLDLAPDAVILLHHLCYAAGNSEPGGAQPTVTVAHQRLDNYAAGFLKAGASAVIADGHRGPEGYLRALFTTHQTVEHLWRTQPNSMGHIVAFNSTRTPGATAFSDPDATTSGFYRSLVGDRTVTTDDVLGEAYSATSGDPAGLVVPGRAEVATDGAGLYAAPAGLAPAATGEPVATLAVGTRLRVVASADVTALDNSTVLHVQGLDDPSIDGFMAAGSLTPRDSKAPVIRSLSTGGALSPNGDTVSDTATLSGRLSESASWKVQVIGVADAVLFSKAGSGSTFSATWDGTASGTIVPDGSYDVRVTAVDGWANGPTTATAPVVVDTAKPHLTALTPDPAAVDWFAPNGDGSRETVALTATSSELGSLAVRVRDGAGKLVRRYAVGNGSGPTKVTWDGKNASGSVVPDGEYIIRISPIDLVGNTGAAAERTVRVISALRSVARSRALFYPQDLDRLAKTTTLSFALARPMTVSWTVHSAAGEVVVTHLDAVDLPAGAQTWVFDGRRADGTMLPTGRYVSYVLATDGTLTASQAVAFDAMAFLLKPSDTTPRRGQLVTIRATTAEPLSANPRLYITQPGRATWSVPMTRTSSTTYKATVRLKTGGPSGRVTFQVRGKDSNRVMQRTGKSYPLH